ncbi:MAG: hypothetical protein Q4D98_07110 [Planctomycetia bacterium]|nr:hypothetical protein [Planctomycetia bacterium]
MYYNQDNEFVNTHSKKIDEESSKFRFIKSKELHKEIYFAGIDFPQPAALEADSDCAERRNGTAANPADWEANTEENKDSCANIWSFTPHHILIGGMNHSKGSKGALDSDERNRLLPGGIAWLEGTPFYGGLDGGTTISIFGPPAPPEIIAILTQARQERASTGKDVLTSIAGIKCLVGLPLSGNVHFLATVKFGGVSIAIHGNPNGNIPTAQIVYNWEVFEEYEIHSFHASVMAFLERLGIVAERTTLSRLDIQITAGVPITSFWSAMEEMRFRCRQKKRCLYSESSPESFEIGKHGSPIMFRTYDKFNEVWGNSEKKCLALAKRFEEAGEQYIFTNQVTRFEFEMRRNFLKVLGIDTLQDLKEKGGSLVNYLGSWIRFNTERIDGHPEREVVMPEWNLIREMFHIVFGQQRPFSKIKPVGGELTAEQQIKNNATITTLIAKNLLAEYQRTGEDIQEIFKKNFSLWFHDVELLSVGESRFF